MIIPLLHAGHDFFKGFVVHVKAFHLRFAIHLLNFKMLKILYRTLKLMGEAI